MGNKEGRMDEKFRTNTELEDKKQGFFFRYLAFTDQVEAEKILEAEASFHLT